MASTGNYAQSKFNLASQGGYAAGSTFKVMVLMTALRRGVDPDSTTYTSMPLKFNDPTYGPIDVHTFEGTYAGRENLVKATLTSDNTVYQQLDLDVGPPNVTQTARDMGIKSPMESVPAEGLGGLQARRLAAGDGQRLRDDRLRRLAQQGHGRHEGLLPQAARRLRLPRREAAPPQGLRGRRHRRGDEDPQGERPVGHRRPGADRLPGRGQDRHGRRLHRRVVRRLHAEAVDLGLGRPRQRPPRRSAPTRRAARSPRRSGAST